MAVPWGSIISAGASLLGSIFGGGSKKQETTTVNRVDYKRMVRDAEAAGFNPLTALRNGGAAGFSISSSTTPAVPLSSRIADGLSAGTQSFLANFDPFADQKRELETRLVEAQIRNLTASSDAFRSQSFNVPGRTAGTVERRPSGQAAQLAVGPAPESGDRTVTNPWSDFEVNPYYLDAEAFEARYGDSEVAQMWYGARNMVADHFWNTKRQIDLARPAYQRKQAANERRKARIGAAAARNAADLGFGSGW